MMRIGIVGLGLIGGSLGLDLVRGGHRVWGVSKQAETCRRAVERGAVQEAKPSLAFLADLPLDLVLVCTPLRQTLPTIKLLAEYLDPGVTLSDVASVKVPIMEGAGALWPGFLGGHPMAGTAAQGIEAAQEDLFRGHPYVITPGPDTPPLALERLGAVVETVQAEPILADPVAHDTAVAWISHLPVMVSANLIRACCEGAESETLALAQRLASSGFRDTSRVGGGNAELGAGMAELNAQALLQTLRVYREQLEGVITRIEKGEWQNLQDWLQQAHEERPWFLD